MPVMLQATAATEPALRGGRDYLLMVAQDRDGSRSPELADQAQELERLADQCALGGTATLARLSALLRDATIVGKTGGTLTVEMETGAEAEDLLDLLLEIM